MFDPTRPMDSQYEDPFANPFNPMTATRANWNIDPVYTTPGYTANFRPAYAGPQGYQTPQGNMGFWEGVSRGGLGGVMGPDWQRTPMYMNPVQYQAASTNAAIDPIQEGATGFGTHIAAPFAAFALGELAMSARYRPKAQDAAMWLGGQWANAWGKSPAEVARAGATRTVGGGIGAAMGRGTVGGALRFGAALTGMNGNRVAGSAMGRFLTGAGGLAGSVAGRLGLPLMVGQGLMSAVEHTFVDPYVAIRRGQKAFMNNFANQYVGDGGGVATGFGMSRTRASDISTAVTKDSIRDHAFEAGDYNIISDYASQAGMFNDVKDFDVQTMRNRVKNLASQVKTVMAVANEPSVQEAVKMLAKLKQSGATDVGGFAGTVLSNIGSNAAVSGISTQQMMNTVGATGQYLYQSQGLTPFIGMQQAGSIHSGFATAFRSGLIDPAAMARMGGIEGATQSAMAGQLGLARSNYNMMTLANQYMFGGSNRGNWTGNIGSFGSNMASDPLGTMGLMGLFGNEMVSAQMQKDPTAIYDQVFQRMNDIYGKNSVGKFAAVAKGFGLSDDQILSNVELMRGAADGSARGLKMDALRGNLNKSYMSTMAQHNLDYADSWMGAPVHGWRNMSRAAQGMGANAMGSWNRMWAKAGDWLEGEAHNLKYSLGDTRELSSRDLSVSEFYRTAVGEKGIGFDLEKYMPTTEHGMLMSGDGRATSMMPVKTLDKRAIASMTDKYSAFMGAVNGTEAGQALAKAIKSGDVNAVYEAVDKLGSKIDAIGGEGGRDAKVRRLIRDMPALKGTLNDSMVYKDGRSSSHLGAINRSLKGMLGDGFRGSAVQGMSIVQQAQGLFMGGRGNLSQYLQEDGALTPEAQALYDDATSQGLIEGVDGTGNRVAALSKFISKTTQGSISWGQKGLQAMRTADLRDVDNKEQMLEKFRKGNTYGLSREQIKDVRSSGNTQEAAKKLQAYVLGKGAQEAGGIQTAPASATGLHKLGTDTADQAMAGILTSTQSVDIEMDRLNALAAAAGQMDFTKFEQVKAAIDMDLTGKQVEAADRQLRAAKINEELAEGKLQERNSWWFGDSKTDKTGVN